jgi:hypothetical protein
MLEPRERRILALPVALLAGAALAGGLAWTTLSPSRWLVAAVVSALVFGVYRLVLAVRRVAQRRRAADDWLRTSTGAVVPSAYRWRAAQLCAPRERRTLARTLRQIERAAYERPVGRLAPLYLPAVREHRDRVRALADRLENLEEPVTPAGMLRVADLVQNGGGPLWATRTGPTLGDAIATTLAILTPGAHDPRRRADAA